MTAPQDVAIRTNEGVFTYDREVGPDGIGLEVGGTHVVGRHRAVSYAEVEVQNTVGANGATAVVATLPAGAVLLGVFAQITEAFNGTVREVTVGDGTTADAYVTALDLTEATLNSVAAYSTAGVVVADTPVTITYSNNGGTPNTGRVRVTVVWANWHLTNAA